MILQNISNFVQGAIVLVTLWAPMASAATEEQKLAAIQKGMAYLYNTQQAGGNWNVSGRENDATGAAVFAL